MLSRDKKICPSQAVVRIHTWNFGLDSVHGHPDIRRTKQYTIFIALYSVRSRSVPAIRHRHPLGAGPGGTVHPRPRAAGVRRYKAGPLQSLPQQQYA